MGDVLTADDAELTEDYQVMPVFKTSKPCGQPSSTTTNSGGLPSRSTR